MYLGFGDVPVPDEDLARTVTQAIILPSPNPLHLYPTRTLVGDERHPPGITMYHRDYHTSNTVNDIYQDHHDDGDSHSVSVTSTSHSNEVLSIFGESPKAKAARTIYIKIILGGSLLIIVSIFTVFSIYWGALWDTTNHVHNIEGWAVDFDGGPIGQTVISAFEGARSKSQITWIAKDASEFPNGPSDLAEAVRRHDCWLAVSVNPQASSNLDTALSSVNTAYNGSLAITAYGNEARNENGYRAIFSPQLQAMLSQITTKYAMETAKRISSSEILEDLLSKSPQTVLQPIYFTIDNLHPFNVPVATAVTFVCLTFLSSLILVINVFIPC
jgi:hypothetical protein